MHRVKIIIIPMGRYLVTDQFLIFPKDIRYIFNKHCISGSLKLKSRCQIYKMSILWP